MKRRRQSVIRDIVTSEAVRSQEQLRQRLVARGFAVTQATLSRDIKELELVKRSADGAYHATGDEAKSTPATHAGLGKAFSEFLLSVEPVQQLIVLKTGAGQAQMLGLAIDRSRLPEVVGTLAGDDTILVICRDARGAAGLAKHFKALWNG
jgi:transcriptional regulator of arginine metabolism